MQKITVLAYIYAENGSEEKVYQELVKLIPLTRVEEGCLNYTLHISNDDPRLFIMYEIWKNEACLGKHSTSIHFQNFLTNTEGHLKKIDVHKSTMVEEI